VNSSRPKLNWLEAKAGLMSLRRWCWSAYESSDSTTLHPKRGPSAKREKPVPTFDVVLHTNGGLFRAQQLLASFPPVEDRIDLGLGLWLGRLDGDLASAVMDTCDPAVLGIPKPVRQYAQFYAYVRELDDDAELYRWDTDFRLQDCVGLSRLIH